MRRRMMLEQKPEYVVTFDDLVDALVAFGCPTGTDSTGFYVDAQGGLIDGKHFFDGRFEPNKSYEVYVRGADVYSSTFNLTANYTDSSVAYLAISSTGTTNITLNSKTVGFFSGIYAVWTQPIYDFYIKEV